MSASITHELRVVAEHATESVYGFGDTATRLRLSGPLNRQACDMTSIHAGTRRNRRPTGEIAVPRKIRLAPETEAAFQAAAEASGNLSMSLYLERLAAQLRTDLGALPVLSPATASEEADTTTT